MKEEEGESGKRDGTLRSQKRQTTQHLLLHRQRLLGRGSQGKKMRRKKEETREIGKKEEEEARGALDMDRRKREKKEEEPGKALTAKERIVEEEGTHPDPRGTRENHRCHQDHLDTRGAQPEASTPGNPEPREFRTTMGEDPENHHWPPKMMFLKS